jgi:hypothetical protein
MKLSTAAALTLLVAATATRTQEPGQQDQPAKEEFQRLQGTWHFESVEENGQAVPADKLKGR